MPCASPSCLLEGIGHPKVGQIVRRRLEGMTSLVAIRSRFPSMMNDPLPQFRTKMSASLA